MNIASRFRVISSTVFVAIACCFLFAGVTLVLAADSPPPNPATCHLTAQVTADNDIRLDGDSRSRGKPAAIPPAVVNQLRAAATKFLAKLPPGSADGLTCKDFHIPTKSRSHNTVNSMSLKSTLSSA